MDYSYAITNLVVVFLLAVSYSVVELMAAQISIRLLLRTISGWLYLLLNGFLGVAALLFAFKAEIYQGIIFTKILLAGTSALALLRVIALPIKHEGVDNRVVSMIEMILDYIRREYDRQRSNFDLQDIKEIMHDVDYNKAADSLPLLINSLLQTLKAEEAKKLSEDIQSLLTLEEGKRIKHLILGAILAKYMGIKMLRTTVDAVREFISVDNAGANEEVNMGDEDLATLLKRYV